MKTKSIFPLFLLAGTLLTAACATPTAKQAGNNSFEWGQVPQQPDLSWADSVGSRQMPGNHVILSANSFGAVADSTVLSTEAIQKAIMHFFCYIVSFFVFYAVFFTFYLLFTSV